MPEMEEITDIGSHPRMTATLSFDLSKPEAIELVGEFLENFNVCAITVASGGRQVSTVGVVMSLVPSSAGQLDELGELESNVNDDSQESP